MGDGFWSPFGSGRSIGESYYDSSHGEVLSGSCGPGEGSWVSLAACLLPNGQPYPDIVAGLPAGWDHVRIYVGLLIYGAVPVGSIDCRGFADIQAVSWSGAIYADGQPAFDVDGRELYTAYAAPRPGGTGPGNTYKVNMGGLLADVGTFTPDHVPTFSYGIGGGLASSIYVYASISCYAWSEAVDPDDIFVPVPPPPWPTDWPVTMEPPIPPCPDHPSIVGLGAQRSGKVDV